MRTSQAGLRQKVGKGQLRQGVAADRVMGGRRAEMDQRSGIDLSDPAVPPGLSPSLMRMSVPTRLAIAAAMSLLLWAAVYWALA